MDTVTTTTTKGQSNQKKKSTDAVAQVLTNAQLLSEILSKLWSVPALARGRLVSRQWLEVIEQIVLPSHRHLYVTFTHEPYQKRTSPTPLEELDKPDRFDLATDDHHLYRELERHFNLILFSDREGQPPLLRVVYDRQARRSQAALGPDYAEFSREQVALLGRWFPNVELVHLNLGMNSRFARGVEYQTETGANLATLLAHHWPRLHTLSVVPGWNAVPLFRGECGQLLARKLRRLHLDHAYLERLLDERAPGYEPNHFAELFQHRLEHFSLQTMTDEMLDVGGAATLPPLGDRCHSLALDFTKELYVSRLASWMKDRCSPVDLACLTHLSLGKIQNRDLDDEGDEEQDDDNDWDYFFMGPKPYNRYHPNAGVKVFDLLGTYCGGLTSLTLEFDYDYFYAKLSPGHFASLSNMRSLYWLQLKRVELDLAEFDGGQQTTQQPLLPSVGAFFLSQFCLTGVMFDPDDDSDQEDRMKDSHKSSSDSSDSEGDSTSSSDDGKEDDEQGDDEVFDPERYSNLNSNDVDKANKKKKQKSKQWKKTFFDADDFCRMLSRLVPNLSVLGLYHMQHGIEHILEPIKDSCEEYFHNKQDHFEVMLVS